MTAIESALSARLQNSSARVGILGLGYVGLPLAMEFCRKGFSVLGFDIDLKRVAALKRGKSYVADVSQEELAKFRKQGLFAVSSDERALSRCEVLLVCVQTPLRKTKEPDLSHIASAMGMIARRPRAGRLIVIGSTIFPGATQEVLLPILEKAGGKLDRDFFLAFSPERVDPGNARYKIANTPKIVGGATAASGRLAAQLYSRIIGKVVPVSSVTAAEVAKLLENSFRAVNIALVNEMAQICHRLGVDVWEVVSAAATKPFGFMPFYPGPGIGGHCIPKDPQLLTWKMKTLNYEPRFIELATTINGSMPRYAVERLSSLLNRRGKALSGSRILVLGVAYKADASDYRESPALDIMQLLIEAGCRVVYHDAYVPEINIGSRKFSSRRLTDAEMRSADCVIITAAHGQVDYDKVCRLAKTVFDARNATKGLKFKNIERL